MTWRYHALRLLDRTWVHRDLPLADVSISPALSGPGAMAASLAPEWVSATAEGGEPLLQEWRDLIIAEASDEVRFAGILVGSEYVGQKWQLDIAGVSAWVQGQPQVATLSYGVLTDPDGPRPGVGTDPLEVVRDLWDQVQAQPDADLGVAIGGSTSSAYRMAHWYGIYHEWDYHPDASTTVTVIPYGSAGADDVATNEQVMVEVAGTGFTRTERWPKTKTVRPGLHAGPYWRYVLYDYETTDVGAKVNELAKATPFDYIERAAWTDADKSDVELRVDLGAPRIGARRSRLRFVEGENVSEIVAVRQDGEDYANGILAIGAGDGKDQLRQTVVRRDGRLRRIRVVTASQVNDAARLKATATSELNRVNQLTNIEQFTVREHPHAPYGSYNVGDDVLVQVATGWAAGTSLWVRITALTYRPDSDSVQVTCTRSDSFSYGSTNLS